MTKGQRHGDEGLAIGRKTMQPVQDFVKRCRAAGRPFFVWYAPMLPHDPHDPPPELVEHYSSKTDSVHVARYWGNVERFDRTVGELLDFLDAEQLAADTLVVYVTDNGWIQRPDAPRFAPRSKLSPYDGGLRTPIMLRRPGTIMPRTSEALASSLDLMPTVLAACGVPARPRRDEPAAGAHRFRFDRGPRPGLALPTLFQPGQPPGSGAPRRRRPAARRKQRDVAMPRPNPEPVEPSGPAGIPGRK